MCLSSESLEVTFHNTGGVECCKQLLISGPATESCKFGLPKAYFLLVMIWTSLNCLSPIMFSLGGVLFASSKSIIASTDIGNREMHAI